MAKAHPGFDVVTTVIRAAMMLRLVHANKNVALDWLGLPGLEDACNAAHCLDGSLLPQPPAEARAGEALRRDSSPSYSAQ